ncbi:MAG: NAD(+)/NADH kinase, partial [Pseudomonadota bacterium]
MRAIHFLSSKSVEALETYTQLTTRYGQTVLEKADVIVAIGGDGPMLHALHTSIGSDLPVYGLNRGSVG